MLLMASLLIALAYTATVVFVLQSQGFVSKSFWTWLDRISVFLGIVVVLLSFAAIFVVPLMLGVPYVLEQIFGLDTTVWSQRYRREVLAGEVMFGVVFGFILGYLTSRRFSAGKQS
jgi:hypothetical protein